MKTFSERAQDCALSLSTALFVACKDKRGSIGAICELYALKVPTLTNKLNPACDTHHCNPSDIEAVLAYTKDPRIMDAICAAHGSAAWYPIPQLDDGSGVELFASYGDLAEKFGKLGKRLFESLEDGQIDDDELDMLIKCEAQIHTATAALIAAVRRKRGESI